MKGVSMSFASDVVVLLLNGTCLDFDLAVFPLHVSCAALLSSDLRLERKVGSG